MGTIFKDTLYIRESPTLFYDIKEPKEYLFNEGLFEYIIKKDEFRESDVCEHYYVENSNGIDAPIPAPPMYSVIFACGSPVFRDEQERMVDTIFLNDNTIFKNDKIANNILLTDEIV